MADCGTPAECMATAMVASAKSQAEYLLQQSRPTIPPPWTPSPVPTWTPWPTLTPTPWPTWTPQPTFTPFPTWTPQPTQTAVATATMTSVPAPTQTPEALVMGATPVELGMVAGIGVLVVILAMLLMIRNKNWKP